MTKDSFSFLNDEFEDSLTVESSSQEFSPSSIFDNELFMTMNARDASIKCCDQCGTPIPEHLLCKSRGGRPVKYCSKRCRDYVSKATQRSFIYSRNAELTAEFLKLGEDGRKIKMFDLLKEHVLFRIGFFNNDRPKYTAYLRQSEAISNPFMFKKRGCPDEGKTIYHFFIAHVNANYPQFSKAIYDNEALLPIAQKAGWVPEDYQPKMYDSIITECSDTKEAKPAKEVPASNVVNLADHQPALETKSQAPKQDESEEQLFYSALISIAAKKNYKEFWVRSTFKDRFGREPEGLIAKAGSVPTDVSKFVKERTRAHKEGTKVEAPSNGPNTDFMSKFNALHKFKKSVGNLTTYESCLGCIVGERDLFAIFDNSRDVFKGFIRECIDGGFASISEKNAIELCSIDDAQQALAA